MPIDPRTLAPSLASASGPPPVIQSFDGGGPNTVFEATIDGGSPSDTGPIIDGDQGTP